MALDKELLGKIKEIASDKNKKLLLESFVSSIFDEIKKDKGNLKIPLSIFVKELGPLEAICKYLKENLLLSYKDISVLTARNQKTVWCSYNNAANKFRKKLSSDSEVSIPIELLKNRSLSTLENLVLYLKEKLGLRFVDISILLNRSQQNILTIYKRARKKNA